MGWGNANRGKRAKDIIPTFPVILAEARIHASARMTTLELKGSSFPRLPCAIYLVLDSKISICVKSPPYTSKFATFSALV